jgi:hypothetical protein
VAEAREVVDDVARGKALVLRVVRRPVEVVGPGKLGVLAHHHLAGEAVGVVDDDPDQPAEEIDVCSATLVPLVVDLDENHIVGADDPPRSGKARGRDRTVDLQPVGAHEMHQRVDARETIPHRVFRAAHHVKHLGAVVPRRVEDGAFVLIGGGEISRYARARQHDGRHGRKAQRVPEPGDHVAAGRNDDRSNRRQQREGRRGERGLLAWIGEPTGLRAGSQQQPRQGKDAGKQGVREKPTTEEPGRCVAPFVSMARPAVRRRTLVEVHRHLRVSLSFDCRTWFVRTRVRIITS